MKKVYILSIQGTELVNDGSGQYFDRSFIKVIDLNTGNKLDWKLGIFTQTQEQYHTDNEIAKLEDLGLKSYRVTYNKKCNEDAEKLAYKYGIDWANYEEDDNPLFDGWVFVGEVELDKAKELSSKYLKNNYVY